MLVNSSWILKEPAFSVAEYFSYAMKKVAY